MVKTAIVVVHWPGKDTPACADHASKLSLLARHIGFTVTMTPCEVEAVCTNCRNDEERNP
jgi:uncharacterized NAD-dependent epimerase/dehydratase family protein